MDTSWIHDREDLPRLVRAGRHIARPKRYIRNYADEVEPLDVPAAVAEQAQRGDGWVKLVGDWISREEGDLAPSWPRETFEEAIRVAHEHGARVTAHCFGRTVLPWLIESGIDCIEHGTGLTPDLVDAMVEHGTALVPTVMQLNNFPQYAEAGEERFPAYAATIRDLHARRRETIMSAHEAGVPIYAGTDAGGVLPHGGIAGEVLELAAYGFSTADALGAASWHAREWLGWNADLAGGGAGRLRRPGRRPAGRPVGAADAGPCRAARADRALSATSPAAAGGTPPRSGGTDGHRRSWAGSVGARRRPSEAGSGASRFP